MSLKLRLLAMVPLIVGCAAPERPGPELLVDVAQAAGLDFVHENGMTGEYYFAETVGAGVALFDFDRDGDLDVYLVQGGPLEQRDRVERKPTDRLYRNDITVGAGSHELRFVDVTEASGLRAEGYGMGVATGDVDNDGHVDVYLSNLGGNELWRNLGDGTFLRDDRVPPERRWSASSSFADLDADGWLDLFVVNYTDFRVATHRPCSDDGGLPNYCGPRAFEPVGDRLFRNQGEAGFQDASASAGILAEETSGLGVVATDFDNDGLLDVYVANDLMVNQLWHNSGDGLFEDWGLVSGGAVNAMGRIEASMGVEVADLDNDGDEDLFMTHLLGETNTFYRNDGGASYTDLSASIGVAAPSMGLTGFGAGFLDIDSDGWLDLLIANGAVKVIEEQRAQAIRLPLRQPNQLLVNEELNFVDVSTTIPALQRMRVSRGLAVGDIDNDGAADAVITNNNEAAELLSNRAERRGTWLGVRLVAPSGRPALGALARVSCEDVIRSARVRTDGSYLSSRDPRLLFGLGRVEGGCDLEMKSLQGQRVRLVDLAPGHYYTVGLPGNKVP